MIVILHPAQINWFHEAVARDIHDDLAEWGVPSRRVTATELMAASPQELGPQDDLLIVNFYECAEDLLARELVGQCLHHFDTLRERVAVFRRRILVNLDSIYTQWFRTQMSHCRTVLTDIFDLTLSRQTEMSALSGVPYTWLPETLTAKQTRELPAYSPQREFPWAMIGHVTPDRAALAAALCQSLGSDGFLFLPALRPSFGEGKRNLAPAQLDHVIQHTRYYVWSSHHGFPYHEGLRALHAVRNGAIPVKVEPQFAWAFEHVPWVYPDVEALMHAIRSQGPGVMFESAVQFVKAPGTLGQQLVRAMRLDAPAVHDGAPSASITSALNSTEATPPAMPPVSLSA